MSEASPWPQGEPDWPLMVGDVLHGFCGGHLGRDWYACSRVEARGADWAVLRELHPFPGPGALGFVSGSEDITGIQRYRDPRSSDIHTCGYRKPGRHLGKLRRPPRATHQRLKGAHMVNLLPRHEMDRIREDFFRWRTTPAPCGISHVHPYNPCLAEREDGWLMCINCGLRQRFEITAPSRGQLTHSRGS